MNTKHIIIGISFTSLLFSASCSGDFLDKQPTDQISSETFYKSKADFEMSLTACYATLQDHMYTHSVPFLECLTDNGYNKDDYWSSKTISQGPIVPTTGGIDFVYEAQYTRIARYNIFLKQLGGYGGTDINTDEKRMFEAEVRLLRGMSYFELYKFYGDIPLVLEPLTYETQDQPKAERAKIYAQILEDIDFAINTLPAVSFLNNGGHFVKSSAQIVKARALLYMAYNDDKSAKPDIMSEVKQITQEIISTGFYRIAPQFRALFCDDLGQQDNNPEYVFAVRYLGPLNNAASFWGASPAVVYLEWGTGGECNPLPNFVKEFDFIDGTPFTKQNPLYNPENEYENRDPRMGKTIFTNTATFENDYSYTAQESPTNYSLHKIVTGADAKNPRANNLGSDWPAMRYAEVLLMFAEAANEVDGATAEVYKAINQIRQREDIGMPPLAVGLSKAQMRVAIRKERRIELAFEGFRYDDIRRWKIAEEKLNIDASEAVIPRSFEKKNYVWPIPQAEINKSKGILIQNPDYK